MSLAWRSEDEESSEGEEVDLAAHSVSYTIKDWDALRKTKKIDFSVTQTDADRKLVWRVDVGPKGHSMLSKKDVSIHVGAGETSRFQKGWYREVEVQVSLVHPHDDAKSVTQSTRGRLSEKHSQVGWDAFISREAIADYVHEDSLTLRLEVLLVREKGCSAAYRSPGYSHDSKRVTGYCGIRNQGATCYLNSLLQALYLIGPFRRGVYQMPTENDEPKESVALALQRLFYRLQNGTASASTKELTASFGWDISQVFQQQDVQELNRVLQDRVEEAMKGTAAEDVVPGLFRGKMVSYIKCLNIEYESRREEDYYDISLDVEGCKNVVESFKRYTLAERLDGENQYAAEGHGLQDAEKGIKFLKFPPVLHLQLKRFAFDMQTLRNYKVNSRYEFDSELELRDFLDPKSEHPTSDCTTYVLQGVFIHSGSLGGGHYYAFFRPTTKRQWFKFDDSNVTRVTPEHVMENSYGGKVKRTVTDFWKKESTTEVVRANSAYMLQYVRRDYMAEALAPVVDIPAHITQRFEEEERARALRKKEKAEAHLYLHVKVFVEADLLQHDLVDLIDFDRFRTEQNLRVRRSLTLPEFQRDHVASVFNVPPERQRFFIFSRRKNKTIRATRTLKLNDASTLGEIFQRYKRADIPELRLLLDVSQRTAPPYFDPIPTTHCQIFFKFYNPDARQLRYFHRTFLPFDAPLGDYAPSLRRLLGLQADTELTWFEELSAMRMESLSPASTIRSLELGNGDIVVVQLTSANDASTSPLRPDLTQSGHIVPVGEQKFPSARGYFQYLCQRVSVTFKKLESYREDAGIRLLMVKTNTYSEVQALLAQHLEGVEPSHIRFTKHTQTGERPHWNGPVSELTRNLAYLIEGSYKSDLDNDIVYYEVLPCSVKEMLTKLVVPIKLLDAKQQLTWQGDVVVDRNATVKELTEALLGDERLGDQRPTSVRFYTAYYSKVRSVLEPDARVDTVVKRGGSDLLCEAMGAYEAEELAAGAKLVRFCHVEKTYSSSVAAHGTPFVMAVKDGIKLEALRKKISERLGERFGTFPILVSKGNYAGISRLEEGDTVSLSALGLTGYIGIEHPRAPRASRRGGGGVTIAHQVHHNDAKK